MSSGLIKKLDKAISPKCIGASISSQVNIFFILRLSRCH